MLSFLNPGVLWALPLAGAPILLHLFFLRRAKTVLFGDLTLLRAAFAQARPATRLRQWLLLLLRCLLLASLILAFSRPVFHAQGASGEQADQGVDMVLLVDTSWSMSVESHGKTRFQWAVSAGAGLMELLKAEDRAAVAGFSDALEGELAWSENREVAGELLSRLRVGDRTTDIAAALEKAFSLLNADKAEGRKKIVVVLSDGAGHVFRGLPAQGVRAIAGYSEDISIVGLEWDRSIENSGVADVRPVLAAGDKERGRGALQVRASMFGGRRENWNLDLYLRGRRADQRNLTLEEGYSDSLTFLLPPARTGEYWGRFELRKDALAADDVFYFSLRMQPPPKVLLLYGSPNYLEAGQGGYFIKKLLGEGTELPYHLDMTDAGRLDRIRLEDYSAVIMADFKRLGPGVAETVQRYVLRGGGLWVIAGTQADEETYLPLERMLPGHLGESETSQGSAEMLVPLDGEMPPEAKSGAFSWSEFDLRKVSLGRRYYMTPAPDAAIWFQDGAGGPLMTAGTFGRGRVLLWASAIDMRWSNLALKPVFTAWLDVGLRYLSGYSGRESWRTLNVGDPIVRIWAPGDVVPARVQIRGPGGKRASIIVRDRKVEYADTREPGMYFLQSALDDAAAEAYAVNSSRVGPEGDLTASAAPPWRALRIDDLKTDFLRAVYGREVRTGVLAAAVVCLLLELLLSRPRQFVASVLLLLCLGRAPAFAQQGDRFVWTQLKYTGAWDPYPRVHEEILNFVTQVTSVIVAKENSEVALKDPALFSSPLLILSGKQAPPELDNEEVARLRDYLTSGGFLWIEDASGTKDSRFDHWVRSTLTRVLPDSDLKPLPSSHVLFKTFFLMRRIGGRVMISGSVEGAQWAGKTVVLYSRNDILGAWAKDPLGKYLYECVPGGEAQRMEARKLTLNIVMYSLTGSYKADAVHQPFILEKMRQP